MKGLLVNYNYCTNCHSCEVACRKYHGWGHGEFGIKISEVGPYRIAGGSGNGKDRWEWYYAPSLTKQCTLCPDRVAQGKMPLCVQHCQALAIRYGEVEDLVKKIDDKSRWALLVKEQ